jgi:hypothetical protein
MRLLFLACVASSVLVGQTDTVTYNITNLTAGFTVPITGDKQINVRLNPSAAALPVVVDVGIVDGQRITISNVSGFPISTITISSNWDCPTALPAAPDGVPTSVYPSFTCQWNGEQNLWQLITQQSVADNGANYQMFAANGTWKKPDKCGKVSVYLWHGGGGGGSGRVDNVAVQIHGGGGGGASSPMFFMDFACSALPSQVTITVGAGGGAGAPAISPANGASGGTGGLSSFGTLFAPANAPSGGSGGTAAAAGGAGAVLGVSPNQIPGVNGGNGAAAVAAPVVTAQSSLRGAGAGGGGGGTSAAGTTSASARASARAIEAVIIGTATGNNGITCTAGTAGTSYTDLRGGEGGGGGGSTTTTSGCAGGAGGVPGGGGGGGSAGIGGPPTTSGAGGAGGAGRVFVVSM